VEIFKGVCGHNVKMNGITESPLKEMELMLIETKKCVNM
jgi:hypothetical protein